MFPKNYFLLTVEKKKNIQISLKTNTPSLTKPNPKFYLLMRLKVLIWEIRVTNRKDLRFLEKIR